MVLLDTGTPGTSREIYSEDANDGTRISIFVLSIYFAYEDADSIAVKSCKQRNAAILHGINLGDQET